MHDTFRVKISDSQAYLKHNFLYLSLAELLLSDVVMITVVLVEIHGKVVENNIDSLLCFDKI